MPKSIRPIRIEGNIAYVPLSQGYEAIIDADDVALVDKFNWCVMKQSGKPNYAMTRKNGPNIKNRTIRMHRFIVDAPDGFFVDHIDGDGLNNRRENLRMATHFENARNQKKPKNNTSGFKGVTKAKHNKWMARINYNGRSVFLGLYTTAEEAHFAYSEASRKLHGLFGRTT